MAVSHEFGPHVTFGVGGPSLFWGGAGLIDPRQSYQPGQDYTVPILGWTGLDMLVIDQVPSALVANNIAASQVPVAATPLTLVSVNGAGITVGASVTNLATGQLVSGLLVIDSAPAVITYGQQNPVMIYDPRTAIARAVRIVSVGDDSAATFVVRGYDLYGQPMTETLTGAAVGTVTGKKAFKFIASVTPAGTLSGSAVTVGTTDIIGFPIYADEWPMIDIFYGTPPAILQVVAAATGFVAADNTAVSAVTGDVRGTYVLASASDATKKLVMRVKLQPWNLNPPVAGGPFTKIFGLVNFTS